MSEHYYTENPVSEIREKAWTYEINGIKLSFTSVSGVFAFEKHVDKASELLIKCFSPSGSSIMDLGCGYGAIGLSLKALFGDQDIFLVDINSRAVEYASKNAGNNNLVVHVKKSDLFSEFNSMKFDDIVSNPPIAMGKTFLTKLITDSYAHLNSGGSLWLVAYHNKGGSSLKKIIASIFGNVTDVEKSGGIRVYKAVR